uniref:Uncharacterized protein n=1 Tax=Arundo donax TaxID=35708 RepID=A0A0A9HKM8_ARUDO
MYHFFIFVMLTSPQDVKILSALEQACVLFFSVQWFQ